MTSGTKSIIFLRVISFPVPLGGTGNEISLMLPSFIVSKVTDMELIGASNVLVGGGTMDEIENLIRETATWSDERLTAELLVAARDERRSLVNGAS